MSPTTEDSATDASTVGASSTAARRPSDPAVASMSPSPGSLPGEAGSIGPDLTRLRDPRGRLLTIGWATSVAMWAVAYVTMMGPGLALGEILVAVMLATVVTGGAIAARYGGMRDAVVVGSISAGVNMLLIGSLFGGGDSIEPREAIFWVGALWGTTLVCAAIGGAIGMRFPIADDTARWPSRFAWVTVGTVFLLLVTGGLVTSLREGLAVPDWPNSFGHNMLLYPLSEMKGGIYYEHAHRLYGMLVGLTSIALMALVWRTDRRGWVRGLSVAIFVMVCIQGIKGGLRVTGRPTMSADPELLEPNIVLAIAHGTFSQAVFAALVVLAVVMSARWIHATRPTAMASGVRDRALGIVCMTLLFVQLVLGASIRHLREPGDIPAWALHGHIGLALVLIALLAFWGIRLMACGREVPQLRGPGVALHALLGTQVLLGLAALVVVLLWNTPEIPVWLVVPTTAHQVTGAALVAAAAFALSWHMRLVRAG